MLGQLKFFCEEKQGGELEVSGDWKPFIFFFKMGSPEVCSFCSYRTGKGYQMAQEEMGSRAQRRGCASVSAGLVLPARTQRWQALLHVTQCVDGGNKVSGFSSEQSRNPGLELGRGVQTQV